MSEPTGKECLAGRDRLIAALDVPAYDQAIRLVQTLHNVRFFKIGLQLFLTGQLLPLIQTLREERSGQVFLDIKWGGDISNTAAEFIRACIAASVVKFITLVEAHQAAITEQTIKAGRAERRKANAQYPHFLMVPYLSSLDSMDLRPSSAQPAPPGAAQAGGPGDVNSYILDRAQAALDLGCDGLIVSGDAIQLCRQRFGPQIDIVSPGIRPSGASHDDHKRFATPSRAIAMGADYLVVGRPIIKASDPFAAAQQMIDEIDRALELRSPHRPPSTPGVPPKSALAAAWPDS